MGMVMGGLGGGGLEGTDDGWGASEENEIIG
jgi:hypothetical protein